MKTLFTLFITCLSFLSAQPGHAHIVLAAPNSDYQQIADPHKIALDYIQSNLDKWKLTRRDIAEMKVSDIYTDQSSGITRIYFQQYFNGILVYNAILNVCMTKEGNVFYSTSRFIPDIQNKIKTEKAKITPAEAVQNMASHFGLVASNIRMKLSHEHDEYVFDGASFAREDVTVRLCYQAVNGKVHLAWDVFLLPVGSLDQWSTRIDAISAEILDQDNWTLFCLEDPPAYAAEDDDCIAVTMMNPAHSNSISNPESGTGAQYNVFAAPLESPLAGPRSIVTDPADPIASPYGWHDINGLPGHEYTITRGNNVNAYQDRDNIGYSSGDEPDGGTELHFDFPFDITWEPHEYIDASVVNLFYWMNYLHDFTYRFGFDEASGNFQRNNYNRGGQGNDFVWAVAQCEANGDTLHNNAVYYHKNEGTSPSIFMLDFIRYPKYLMVNEPSSMSGKYITNVAGSGWGPGAYITNTPVTGEVVLVDDGVEQPSTADACQPMINAHELAGKIAMIDRGGGCQFGYKALQAQNAGAIGVIFCNYEKLSYQNIGAGPDGANVNIPVVLISNADAGVLRGYAGKELTASFVNPGTLIPERFDSDFQNNYIGHEYGHGLSIRLVGGPSINCLTNAEQMGEGWSDFLGLITTVLPGDTGVRKRGVGTYVIGDNLTATGTRHYSYSTDMNINPLTYGDVATAQEKHHLGVVWANMLWDMYWAFSDQYGWNENPFEETSGNYKAVRLVVDGLKNLACHPGFVDGRNAILAADSALYNGENGCLIWNVFARRGLGYSADQGSTDDAGDQKEAFDLPPSCSNQILLEKSVTNFIQAGDEINVVLKVGNYKSSMATNVTITDELVEGTKYKPGSASMPVTDHGDYLEFNLPTINQGEEITITYTLNTSTSNKSSTLYLDEVSATPDSTWLMYSIGTGTVNTWFATDTAEAYSGNASWYIHETNTKSHEVLLLNPDVYSFHVAGHQPVLRFFHRYNTKGGLTGGIVEVREVGTTKWESVNHLMLRNGYNSKIDYNAYLVSGIEGFTGLSDHYKASYVDLSPWLGKDIEIRFRFASTINEHEHGYWQIDDIEFMDLVNYNGETCLTSNEGDQICIQAKEHGTIIDSQNPTTGVNTPASELCATIYPNPITDFLNVSLCSDPHEKLKLRLYSMDGKEIINQEFNSLPNGLTIPVNDYLPGIYVLSLHTENASFTEKITIQR